MAWSKPARPGWMGVEDYHRYPQTLTLREVKVRKKVLVATLLSAKKTTKNALGKLFCQRWQVELDLRNIKSTLDMDI
ncbi:MAG: hypothetical protein P8Y45_15830 [Exilibacterium sp.]